MNVLAYGDRGWLIDALREPAAVAERLRRWPWPADAVPETVVGAETCLLRFHGRPPAPEQVRAAVDGALAEAAGRAGPRAVRLVLRVRYDGEDLPDVAAALGCSVEAVIALHTGTDFKVAFLGFAPGFAYLSGLPEALHLPRRPVPRVRVPAGSVAIADRYSAVYPSTSPGGWHLLGRTETVLFDASRTEPSTLRPGMTVRFEALR